MTAEERTRMLEERMEATGRTFRLWAKGSWEDLEVHRVPVDGLLLNIDNRRFAAERKLLEEKLGHSLDVENSPADEMSVISILLDSGWDVRDGGVVGKPSADYLSLKTDWLARHQETPFWIRPDGLVRNGNRRLAMLKRLQTEMGRDGFEVVEAIILKPGDVDEQQLFEMEQREQLTENLKVRYTDINLLLALRDAAAAEGVDWADSDDIDRVAGRLQQVAGGDKAYALIQLHAIKYMDAYLSDSGQPGEYQKLLRQVERFRDVGKVMNRIEEGYPDDATDVLRLAFSAIKSGATHGEIRGIRKVFLEDRGRYEELLGAVQQDEQQWADATGEQLGDPDLAISNEGEDAQEDEEPGPVVPNYPGQRVRTRIQNAIDGLHAAANDDVSSILEQVVNRLQPLIDERDRLGMALKSEDSEDVRQSLAKVIEWADRARELTRDSDT